MMKIGFDAKRAFFNNSGLGNYARTLLKNLSNLYPTNEYHIFSPGTSKSSFTDFVKSKKNIHPHYPINFFDKKFSSLWRSFGLSKQLEQEGMQIYHGLSNEIPFNISGKKIKKIVTIHDLIFLRYPELYPKIDRYIYNIKFKKACNDADVIIAISKQTENDLIEYYNVNPTKIKLIYQSCNELFYQEYHLDQINAVKLKYHLPSKYLLYVGTIEERKNLLTILKALKDVKEIPLVVIGKKTDYFYQISEFIKKEKLEKRIIFLGNIANDELPCIYRAATVFIYPSIFEGFGIPVLEALMSKVPVITSNTSSLPEAGGPDSLFISPKNSEELSTHINKLLTDEVFRNDVAHKGYAYAQRFHPSVVTSQLFDLYKSLIP